MQSHSALHAELPSPLGARVVVLQDLKTLDVAKLTPLSPEVISRQATINIGEQLLSFVWLAHEHSTVLRN